MIISEIQIEDLINKRSPKSVKEINVLRANGQLPVNVQVGATCGIYALQAAFQIKGSPIAPRPESVPLTTPLAAGGPKTYLAGILYAGLPKSTA
jgi:hypothetical protein